MAPNLVELDSLEILAIIDNELDPISPSPNANVKQTRNLVTIGQMGSERSDPPRQELSMSNICCSAHGLSLMITGTKGDTSHTVLFDTGPEESAWERNAQRLRADIGKIEVIQLSHWHRDHSGGMLKALEMIGDARKQGSSKQYLSPVHVDLHPARPDYRGMKPPEMPVISFEADPSFAQIEKVGAIVDKSDQAHTVLDDMFLVSGDIPQVTPYEKGLRFGMRFEESTGEWREDTAMADERFLMCNLKDKGIVMFTGCSHRGVVNASRQALELGGGAPLYAVMGGYHLADAQSQQMEDTARDLKALGVQVLLPGHCTGWRAKFELHKVMPPGCLVPSFVGSQFVL